MDEQKFKATYQQEIDKIHAPGRLIARTKARMAKVREHETLGRKRFRIAFAGALPVAAVLVICLVIWDGSGTAVENPGTGTLIHLGQKGDIYLEEEVNVEKKVILPVVFSQEGSFIEEVSGVEVKFAQDKDGAYMAAYAGDESYVVVTSKITDKETFVNTIIQLIEAEGLDK